MLRTESPEYYRILNQNGEMVMDKILCECGKQISRRRHKAHLETDYHKQNLHKKKVSEVLKKTREELGRKHDKRKCNYKCDRGIHKGKYLEDVVKFHPDYIQFLITHHRSTFPLEFCEALRQCGVEFD